jgi:hypothetical protein
MEQKVHDQIGIILFYASILFSCADPFSSRHCVIPKSPGKCTVELPRFLCFCALRAQSGGRHAGTATRVQLAV